MHEFEMEYMFDARLVQQRIAGKGECVVAAGAISAGSLLVREPALVSADTVGKGASHDRLWDLVCTEEKAGRLDTSHPACRQYLALAFAASLGQQGLRDLDLYSGDHASVVKSDVCELAAKAQLTAGVRLNPRSFGRLLRVIAFNCFCKEHRTEDRRLTWRIFKRFSRVNHSCDPTLSVEVLDGVLEARALRDVEPGEELTFCYLADEWLQKPTVERRKDLQTFWGFVCQCPLCGKQEVDEAALERMYASGSLFE